MIPSSHKRSIGTNLPGEADTSQQLFFGPDPGLDRSAPASLDEWSTDDLLTEALRRVAKDTAALRVMQTRALGALLAAIDRE